MVCGMMDTVTLSSDKPKIVRLTPSTVIEPFNTSVFVNSGESFKS